MQKQWASKQTGFTLVELLIVIVVIAILAAISVVAYNGVQNRARTSAVHADLTSAKKKLMMYSVDNGSYPSTNSELIAAGLSISATSNYEQRPGYSNFYYCFDVDDNEFAIGVRVADGRGSSYYVSSVDGVTPRSGLINMRLTCGLIGLSDTAEAAHSSSGFSNTGSVSSWLQAGN